MHHLTVLICKSQGLFAVTLKAVGAFLIYVCFFYLLCYNLLFANSPSSLKKCKLVISFSFYFSCFLSYNNFNSISEYDYCSCTKFLQ